MKTTSTVLKKTAALCLFSLSAQAVQLDWTGQYRFEYVDIESTSLASPGQRKNYMLHSFVMSPEVIVSDGINVRTRFSLTPNNQYPGSPVGDWLGNNQNNSASNSGHSSVTSGSNTQKTNSSFEVQELYLNYNVEHAQVLAGRWPIHFGLGTTYNSGAEAFAHWRDTYDGVAFKLGSGNWTISPIFTRVYDRNVAQGGQVSDQIWLLEYQNIETQSEFGVFHRTRTSNATENESAKIYAGLGNTSTVTGGWNTQHVNLFIARGWTKFNLKLEAGFESGATGVSRTSGPQVGEVNLAGNSLVTEMNFLTGGKSNYSLKLGQVSGDNPNTPNYEGYSLDRNYDLGFLMMNHPLGQFDVFTSRAQRNLTNAAGSVNPNEQVLDEETVSNVLFVRPEISYQWSDKLVWKNSLLLAQLDKDPRGDSAGTSKNLGIEYNSTFDYAVTERFSWQTRVGLLAPGAAWKGSSTDNFDNKMSYGWETKAAISF